MAEHTIKIEDGKIEFVYSDDLAPLVKALGATVTRASHVEPHPTKPGWLADMRPSGGPILGSNGTVVRDALLGERFVDAYPDNGLVQQNPFAMLCGFALREDALAAEREWLRREKGL